MQQMRKRVMESANVGAVRYLMIGLAALVVLSVSGYGTVIYIQLMGKVFPTGPLQMACYMGAAANLLLMLVLLVGKFVWFRPGAHEVASWLVTGVELLVVILNMILSYQLASGQPLQSLMAAWYYLAPVSPVFSMIGAIVLIMTSSELRKKHHELEIEERKDRAESEFGMAMHTAEMEVKTQYLGFVKTNLVQELNAPERQIEMKNHAKVLVSQVLSGLSGVSSVPLLSSGASSALPAPKDVELETDTDDEWLGRVNARVEAERAARLNQQGEPVTNGQAGKSGVFSRLKERFVGPDPQETLEELRQMRRDYVQQWGTAEGNGSESGGVDEEQAARLARLASAAEAKGYSLDRLEQMLGIEGGDEKKNG